MKLFGFVVTFFTWTAMAYAPVLLDKNKRYSGDWYALSLMVWLGGVIVICGAFAYT